MLLASSWVLCGPSTQIQGVVSAGLIQELQLQYIAFLRAGLSPPKNKENAAIYQSKTGLKSARLGPFTAPSQSSHLDKSPLNHEEIGIYIKVTGIKSAHTIQSQPKWCRFFHMNMPLDVEELRSQVSTPRSDRNALVQDSPIHSSTTATVSLITCSLTVTNHLLRLHWCLM
jgi:hypothetical protein